MNHLALCLSLLAIVLGGAAWHAWQLRNERRDVWLIGATSGASGLGAALLHWL